MQMILREALKVDVRNQEKGVPNLSVQNAQSLFSKKILTDSDVSWLE